MAMSMYNSSKRFMKKILNRIRKRDENGILLSVKVFFIMLVVFFLADVISTAIPNSWVSRNADQSISVLENEGNTSFAYSSQKNDGFSENIMYSMAETRSKEKMNVVAAAMDDTYVSNADPEKPAEVSYSRFWHGYVVFLKPALIFFDINMIRQLVILTFILLVAAVAYLAARVVSIYAGFAFLIAIAVFNPPVVMVNLEYFSTFAVMLVGSIVLLAALAKDVSFKFIAAIFVAIGGLTIFFDFLTTPIITWGIPLTFYIAHSLKYKKYTPKRFVANVFLLSVAWVAGYALIWLSKWLLASAILGKNVVKDALETTNYYTSSDGSRSGAATLKYTLEDMFRLNMDYALLFKPVLYVGAIFSSVVFILLAYKKKLTLQNITSTLVLIAMIVSPFIWMFFSKSHSFIHHWMTNRDFIIAVFAILILSGYLWSKLRIKVTASK